MSQHNPYATTKRLLSDVNIDKILDEGSLCQIVEPVTEIMCVHGEKLLNCNDKVCYEDDKIISLKMEFTYTTNKYKIFSCEIIFETTLGIMFNDIKMYDCKFDNKIDCTGNKFGDDEYHWCEKHLGEYNEYSAYYIFSNSSFDDIDNIVKLMKDGSQKIKVIEITFDEN